MVRDDDNLFWIPYLGASTKFLFKNAKCARAANVVCKQLVNVGPNVCSRL